MNTNLKTAASNLLELAKDPAGGTFTLREVFGIGHRAQPEGAALMNILEVESKLEALSSNIPSSVSVTREIILGSTAKPEDNVRQTLRMKGTP